jgi:hypothetical protein
MALMVHRRSGCVAAYLDQLWWANLSPVTLRIRTDRMLPGADKLKMALLGVGRSVQDAWVTGRNAVGKLFFLIYFSLVGCLTIYLTCTLWLAAPKDVPVISIPAAPDCDDKAGHPPQIKRLDPPTVAIGENTSNIVIFGCNLTPDPKVKFNGLERVAHAADDHELIVQLQTSDFATPGNTLVSVERAVPKDQDPAGKMASNVLVLGIKPASDLKAIWKVWGVEYTITLELRLILLVIVVGGFAACISGMKSFADYVGEDKLSSKWYWFYYAEPFVGAGLAFVFYLVMRGGLLTGTNADIKAVNPFGFAAVAALVGMFSDAAFRKLNEIFDTLFQAKDTRSEKLMDFAITTNPALPTATNGTAYKFGLQAKGGKVPYTWTAVTGLPSWMTLSAQGELGGTPTAAAPAAKFTIQAKDATGATTTQEFTLTVL